VQHKIKLIRAKKDKHMHIHGRCLKLFKYCVNELYFYVHSQNCRKQILTSNYLSVWLLQYMNMMFEDF